MPRGVSRTRKQALWSCPKCGAKLVSRNLWHSCGHATLADWQRKMGPRARALYERFEQLIARCGEYHVSPAKSRIAFLARVRFASITALSEAGMSCSFALPGPVESARFAKVEEVVPGWWVHRLRVREPTDLDKQVQSWLAKSYRLMGMQKRLSTRARNRQSRAG